MTFLGTHVRWNMMSRPAKIPILVLDPHVLRRMKYTLYVPVYDTFEEVCLIPDRDDGSITYTRLFEILHEYYGQVVDGEKRIKSVGEHTTFNGLVATPTRLLLNLKRPTLS